MIISLDYMSIQVFKFLANLVDALRPNMNSMSQFK